MKSKDFHSLTAAAHNIGISPATLKRWLLKRKVAEVSRGRNGWRVFTLAAHPVHQETVNDWNFGLPTLTLLIAPRHSHRSAASQTCLFAIFKYPRESGTQIAHRIHISGLLTIKELIVC
jgi:hypothetical protein